ncbi:glycosyl hydrolase family 95 catalytic domain-containing protein [Sphingobacterium lactis]|uniref:glycoside hydrolase family 95 protein n=1 Tax=Sphingobacterium lactis TaxID=797291 RepID=UPI003DA5BC9A
MKYILAGVALFCAGISQAQDMKLWYKEPAQQWEETLPLGNGQIGMMPDGKINDEAIVLNEISMWSGSKQDANNYEAKHSVLDIQRLLFAGKNDEAEALVNQNFVCVGEGSGEGNGANVPYGAFQNFGYLNFLYFHQGQPSAYKRWLDLTEAKAYTTFTHDGVQYTREYFTSFADNIGIIKLKADKKKSITFAMHFYREEHVDSHRVNGNEILISGALPDGKGGKGLRFAAKFKVLVKGGTLQNHDNQIIVKGADEAVVLYTASTSYYGHDPVAYVEKELKKAETKSYAALDKAHDTEYKPLFNRVSLQLTDAQPKDQIPTAERLAAFYKDPGQDNGLAALYYQFGRYLTLSSTAPKVAKALPPNLQGLWAHQIQTPWNGDYHLNINAQMNHWGVEVSNLSEYHIPFIEMIKNIAVEGKKTAKAYYDAPGWVVYMMTNPWGYTAPGEHASWGASTASGWLCNHLWEHYQFTGDRDYLREIYPVLKEAAEFYKATMVKDPKTGWYVTSPSVSPENGFRMENGKRAAVVMGPTIDNQIVRELYESVIAADQLLNLEDAFAKALQEDIKLLPPAVRVSKSGRVMEWLEDYEEVEPQHRHVSHLYGLYPARFISPVSTPEWAAAAKKTLEVRGDEGTGWSRAWKILFWARLHDGDHALEILRQLLQPALNQQTTYGGAGAGTYPNLFCAHPPFQIDGNFGGSAGIAEMLIQSHDDAIHLLPALPKAWADGQVKGLKARGNYTVDIQWKDGKVVDYKIAGKKGEQVRVLKNGEQIEVTL